MGSRHTRLHLREMIKVHKPTILALLETKVHSRGAMDFLAQLGFTDLLVVEALGYVGGIWLMWNDATITVDLFSMEDQYITVLVKEGGGHNWLLTVVYASPLFQFRNHLWHYIGEMGSIVDIPWVVIGDVNQTLDHWDKHGGRPIHWDRAAALRQVIDSFQLVDLGFQGPQFTWTNGRKGIANIKERIDRAWGNLSWYQTYENTFLRHLARVTSDHHPLLLGDSKIKPVSEGRPFRFMEAWFLHPDFSSKVEEFWTTEPGNLLSTMESFKLQIARWNTDTFGNIFWRKRRWTARILGVKQALAVHPRRSLYALERQLIREFNDILQQEAVYWQQQARAQWLKSGDRNTKFFHMWAKHRRRRTRIIQLKDSDGHWCDDAVTLQHLAREFYVQLYRKDPSISCQPSQWSFPKLSRSSVNWLNRGVTDYEIKTAAFNLGAHKAPGPDGMPACFFQKYWNHVGVAVSAFVLQTFRTGTVPAHMNHSVICLLPKQQCPDSISQFRPICLSNVVIKLVSKVIANRVKRVIGDLVGDWQSGFIPSRQAHHNVVIVQEIIHSLRHQRGKRGLVVKIDLEKAYDRVDWKFLVEVLWSVGFGSELIQVVRSCLESSSLSVLWNGESLDAFKPERGLRQGDPLSPYLFVLCMEVLGQRIQKAVATKHWKVPSIGRRRLPVSHLFFADDLLLFGEASVEQAHIMFDILQTFCGESGQKINGKKSRIWYSPNTPLCVRTAITIGFGVPPTQDLGIYLGVPLIHGRFKHSHFASLVDKVKGHLSSWKGRLMSQAARLILIQTVTNTIPAYSMHTCKLPGKIVAELEKANRRFLWGDSEAKRSLHSVRWATV